MPTQRTFVSIVLVPHTINSSVNSTEIRVLVFEGLSSRYKRRWRIAVYFEKSDSTLGRRGDE